MPLQAFLFLVFFVSGFCGLLYQIIWLRIAFASFGVVTPVISVVISVFMAGLAIGSWLGGKWIGPASARRGRSAIVYYGIIEGLIGCGAFLVPWLFSLGERTLLNVGEADSTTYLALSGVAITVSILPWCILMGATFPAMMAFARERENFESSSFSFLYVANVLGASFGAAVTALALVEILGFSLTLWIGAGFNFAIAAACLLMGREFVPASVTEQPRSDSSVPRSSTTSPRLAMTVLFVTGFASMAMEVVWTRAFTPVMKTSIYAFAALLFTYLLATWIGSRRYRKHLQRGDVMPIGQVMGYLSVSGFLPIVLNDIDFNPHPLIVCLSIVPLCGFLGYLTPHLIDEYSAGRPDHAGKAYAINILGCILGPLIAGYGILPTIGVRGALVLLALPFVILFFITFKTWTRESLQRGLCAAAAVLLLLVSAGWSKLSDDRPLGEGSIVKRDHTATVSCFGSGMEKALLVNGVGITKLTTITKLMMHWPALHLPDKPKNSLVLCMGMGTSFRSALRWDIDAYCVELVPSVRDVMGYYHKDADAILSHPKGRVIIDDARRFLKRTTMKFDVITIDPPPPVEAAGSSLLYSKEFYDLIRLRLNDGGILQQWFPKGEILSGQAAARSLSESFPHVRTFLSTEGWGLHYLCSSKPIPMRTADELLARMPPAVRADLEEWLPSPDAAKPLFERLLQQEYPMKEVLHADPNFRITDDRPFNEYFLLRRHFGLPFSSDEPAVLMVILAAAAIVALVAFRPKRIS